MRDPTASQKFPNAAGVGRKPRADDANRRGGTAHQNPTPSEEGRQDLVAQTGVRRDQAPQRLSRNDEHFAGLGDPGRHEHALARQEIQLAEKPAGRVAGDDALGTLGADHNLHGTGKDDVELVFGVALAVQELTGRHRPANPEPFQCRQLGVFQLEEGIRVGSHDRRP